MMHAMISIAVDMRAHFSFTIIKHLIIRAVLTFFAAGMIITMADLVTPAANRFFVRYAVFQFVSFVHRQDAVIFVNDDEGFIMAVHQ
jgi:hypothetical protein